ncbi:MAG: lasso peptide biosynthesis B2 protein [Bacteroidales bacterium]|nr:lasso peptide biosynthesis B2 protein [Bacteroidales bacterium]
MFSQVKKYFRQNKQERKILNRTFAWLLMSFILVRIIPLKWFGSLLGVFKKEIRTELEATDLIKITSVKRSIRRIKRVLPWKIKCFEEAITAKKVLERYEIKSTLYLGVDINEKKQLKAHAWLRNGDYNITGGDLATKFKVVGFYS